MQIHRDIQVDIHMDIHKYVWMYPGLDLRCIVVNVLIDVCGIIWTESKQT
jgi:hypothetical protein